MNIARHYILMYNSKRLLYGFYADHELVLRGIRRFSSIFLLQSDDQLFNIWCNYY